MGNETCCHLMYCIYINKYINIYSIVKDQKYLNNWSNIPDTMYFL